MRPNCFACGKPVKAGPGLLPFILPAKKPPHRVATCSYDCAVKLVQPQTEGESNGAG